jgi:hypothetical protein
MDSINSANTWRVRAIGVQEFNHSLRWEVEAWNDQVTTIITADSTRGGNLIDIQSENYVGTTGDSTLDVEARTVIADTVAQHTVMRQLDAISGKRLGRSDRLRFVA